MAKYVEIRGGGKLFLRSRGRGLKPAVLKTRICGFHHTAGKQSYLTAKTNNPTLVCLLFQRDPEVTNSSTKSHLANFSSENE